MKVGDTVVVVGGCGHTRTGVVGTVLWIATVPKQLSQVRGCGCTVLVDEPVVHSTFNDPEYVHPKSWLKVIEPPAFELPRINELEKCDA